MKKFLTVLLVIAVMFTFSFGSAFAVSASAADAEKALDDVITEAIAQITYTGNYLTKYDNGSDQTSAEGVSFAAGTISRTAVETGLAELKADYVGKIRNAADGAWDTAYADVDTADELLTVLFRNESGSTPGYFKTILDKQVDIEEAAAYKALEVDLTLYSAADQDKILNDTSNGMYKNIETIKNAVNGYTGSANFATTISSLKGVKTSFDTLMDTLKPVTDGSIDVSKKLQKLATDLNYNATTLYNTLNAATPGTSNVEKARKESFKDDIDRVVSYYEGVIADAVVGGYGIATDKDLKTLSDVMAELNAIDPYIYVPFIAPSTNHFTDSTNLYKVISALDKAELLNTALEKDAADKKAERKADGTLKYAALDVDKALANAKDEVANYLYDAVTTADPSVMNAAPIKVSPAEGDYALQAYKANAFAAISTGTYALANWDHERADKVEALQDEYKEKILVAESTADVDALVKEAKNAMDAILTTAQITALKSRTMVRVEALGYDDMLSKYYDVMVGKTGYGDAIKADAIDNAYDVFKDAVVATENYGITYTQIDNIIKEKKDAAIAAVTNVKTAEELKTAAKGVNEQIATIPTLTTLADKDAILAVQKAMDEYMDLPGANKASVEKAAKLQTAMVTLMNLEAKAVNDAIRALPSTITVADAAKVEAARAAYKALEATYGIYDNTGSDYEAYLGAQTIQGLVTRIATLEKAEADLEAAKVVDTAKKVEALNENSTPAEVAAAKAAYDALKTESKLKFNTELLDKLEKALKVVEVADVKAVEALKLKANSTAKKGSITVKWTVTGDAAVADGFQVWKSTKMNSGYKKAFTTTKTTYKNTKGLKKGVKYYYKVRAYKVVDGKMVYSDWSNKAYRTAK